MSYSDDYKWRYLLAAVAFCAAALAVAWFMEWGCFDPALHGVFIYQ
jgi:hypothetical protein